MVINFIVLAALLVQIFTLTASGASPRVDDIVYGPNSVPTKPETSKIFQFSPDWLQRDAGDHQEMKINKRDACPEIWYKVADDLKRMFHGCTRDASTAIRFAFHDAGGFSFRTLNYGPASGGADGSLLLSDIEISRSENNPMQGFREKLLKKYDLYKGQGVGAADLIQVAAAIAIKSCPGGPVIKTVVGRADDSTAAPENNLPPAFGAGADYTSLVNLFEAKGINTRELAALMGAHTVSRSFTKQDDGGIPYASSQDSSPTVWDNRYYQETGSMQPPGTMSSFESDISLADPLTETGKAFGEFAADAVLWKKTFQDAMYKLSTLGIREEAAVSLADCTAVLG